MKKFRIIKRKVSKECEGNNKCLKYRVDERHRFLFFHYWDHGASSLCPNYLFTSVEEAERAILNIIAKYNI